MNDVEKLVMDRRPIFCKKCGGKLFYQNSGEMFVRIAVQRS